MDRRLYQLALAYLVLSHVLFDVVVTADMTEAEMTSLLKKMRVPEAARYLGLGISTLNKLRCSGEGPRFAKAGSRVVVYDKRDLDEWLEARTCSSTAEYVPSKSPKKV